MKGLNEGDAVGRHTMGMQAFARLICFALCFCTGSRLAHAAAGTGSINGVVRFSDSGAPASGVYVKLSAPPLPETAIDPPGREPHEFVARNSLEEFHAKTDASGTFAISQVPPGEYYVLPFLEGYILPQDFVGPGALSPDATHQKTGLPGFIGKVAVAAGGTSHVTLRLERGGVIEGRVTFGDQSLVPAVAVNLMVKGEDGKFRRALGASHPDVQGHYRFEAVPAGSYVVFAALPGEEVATARGSQSSGGPIIFAGSTIRPSQARVVQVSGTATVSGIDITVPSAGLHTVRGRIEMPGGRPLGREVVRLFPTGEEAVSRAGPLGVDGSFRFDRVAPGDYTVSIEETRETEVVGLTRDGTGVRVRWNKPTFRTARQNVSVTNRDPATVVLRPVALR